MYFLLSLDVKFRSATPLLQVFLILSLSQMEQLANSKIAHHSMKERELRRVFSQELDAAA